MQNLRLTEEIIRHEKALIAHTLMVKKIRTEDERLLVLQLCKEHIHLLELEAPDTSNNDINDVTDCRDEHSVEEQESSSESDDRPIPTPKVPTLAAVVHKNSTLGTVPIKREMNQTFRGEHLGSQRTPVKPMKEVTNHQFFLSPNGTTATYEQTVKVTLKKVSGKRFVEEESTDSEQELSSDHTSS